METTFADAVPLVVQAISDCIQTPYMQRSPHELNAALKCLQAWMSILPAKYVPVLTLFMSFSTAYFHSDLTPLVPLLLSLMLPKSESTTTEFDDQAFILASDTLQELLTKSALSDGSGTKTVTEPLLLWLDRYGDSIIRTAVNGRCEQHASYFR